MPRRHRLVLLQACLGSLLVLSCSKTTPPPVSPVGQAAMPRSSVALTSKSKDLGGTAGKSPGEQENPLPELLASSPALEQDEPGVKIYVNRVTHPSNSFVLAANRNHTADSFPNQEAKTERIRALRPTWGQERYLYRIGHSATDGRTEYAYMTGFHFEQVWGLMGPYPYDDLRFSLQEAKEFMAEQIHVVNFGTSDPGEAGRYVSYLNNPEDPNRIAYPMATDGARYFEIGNELSFNNVRGHNEYAANEILYAQRAKVFAQAMRAASPFPIQIGAVASTNSSFWWDGGGREGEVVKNILQIMGDDVDFLTYHGYPAWPLWDGQRIELPLLMAQNAYTERLLTTSILPAIKQFATHPIQLANTEFFTHQYQDAPLARGLVGALYSADTVLLALNFDMLTAVQFCLDHGKNGDAAFFLDDDPDRVTAIYQFQQMLAKHWGDGQLQIEPQHLPMRTVTLVNGQPFTFPSLALSASKGRDGRVYLMALNRTPDTVVTARISLGLEAKQAIAFELSGSSGWQSEAAQTCVSTHAVDLDAPYCFPGASVTILEITPKQQRA